jgi:CRP-like cAMP-binding protein
MPNKELAISQALVTITNMTAAELDMGLHFFQHRRIKKGEFFNARHTICRNLAFVTKGLFRVYFTDVQTGEDTNIFFFCENQFMVSFKSFLAEIPCYYYVQALEDSEVLQICRKDLYDLFGKAHSWERFGRVLAEQYFYFSHSRTESFVFKTPEERYLDFLAMYANVAKRIPLYQLASYLGIKSPSLSRIRKRLADNKRS